MAHSINHITLLGNIGGVDVYNNMTKLRLATSRAVREGDNWSEVTDWHNVVTFGRTAEYAATNVMMGDKIAIQGKSITSSFINKEGNKVYTTEVHCRELVNCTKRDKPGNGSAEHDEIPF